MRTLVLKGDNWDQWKFGDTNAIMTFDAETDSSVPDYADSVMTFHVADATSSPSYTPSQDVKVRLLDLYEDKQPIGPLSLTFSQPFAGFASQVGGITSTLYLLLLPSLEAIA